MLRIHLAIMALLCIQTLVVDRVTFSNIVKVAVENCMWRRLAKTLIFVEKCAL